LSRSISQPDHDQRDAQVRPADGKQAPDRVRKRQLLVVQPLIAPYRLPPLRWLVHAGWMITVMAGRASKDEGFQPNDLTQHGIQHFRCAPVRSWLNGRLLWQGGMLRCICAPAGTVHWLWGNPRNLTLWITLAVLKCRGQRAYVHGQGPYARPRGGATYRTMWRLLAALSTAYVTYTSAGAVMLEAMGVPTKRLRTAPNSLSLTASRAPEYRDWRTRGILFVGRLRTDSRIELLIAAVARLRARGWPQLTLHVVGDGPESGRLHSLHSGEGWLQWHGALYDDQRIAEIAQACIIGCYPGDAGLSVVQYMGLSLVPIVHNAMHRHMGPEPSEVIDRVNGILFAYDQGSAGLEQAIESVLLSPELEERCARGAWATYTEISEPPLGERLHRIFSETSP